MTAVRVSGLPGRLQTALRTTEARKDFLAGDVNIDYQGLSYRVNQTLNLLATTGLHVGDRIAVACRDEIEMSVLYVAGLRFGLCTAVIDPRASVSEAILLLSAVDPAAMFIDAKLIHDINQVAPITQQRVFAIGDAESGATPQPARGFIRLAQGSKGISTMNLVRARAPFPGVYDAVPEVSTDTTALILFTSGTTSRPKGVELTFGNLEAQFATFVRHYEFDAHSRIINHLPLHHTDGLNQGPAIALYCGCTWLRITKPIAQNLEYLLALIGTHRATHLITVPTVLALIDQLPSHYDGSFSVPSFRFIGSTAGYLDENLWRRFEQRFECMVVNSYGLTETVSEALYCGPNPATRRMGTVGKPVDCEARVVNAENESVPPRINGELIIRGTNVMKGYFNDPVATAAVMREGWFYTGDLAQYDEDGFFYIVGRKKNVIIRAGINVYPEDVTNVVMELPSVLEAATVGYEDRILGQKVVVCVSAAAGTETFVKEVTEQCAARLAPEKRPDIVVVMASLPRGPSGKVVLSELKQAIAEHLSGPVQRTEGTIEERVFELAASVLGVPITALDYDTSNKTFAKWDSLAHLAFVAGLEQQFSIEMNASDIIAIRSLNDAISIVARKAAAA
jgi:long-chain acyl-CoA synthetase